MDISDCISADFVEFTPDTRVSKLVGAFDDPTVRGIVVRGDDFQGVVTRRHLATSHHQPDEKIGSLVWHVPRVAPDEDIRQTAQLMIDSDAQLLPVFEGTDLRGVVTGDAILRAVADDLDAATVADAATRDLVSVTPTTTFGEALHLLRENRIAHLPVIEDDAAVGILSLYDVVDQTVRAEQASQGGSVDAAGSAPRAHGGAGAREGELDRMLDLPVRDMMVSPVRTISPAETLDTAVAEMFDMGGSSLVVTANGSPFGILTKTDILDALTWEAGGNRAVQVYGSDLLDDTTHEDIVQMVDGLDDKDHDMAVLDAKVHLHEHKERQRGTPLLLARIRLHTDRGLFIASGEGYGSSAALSAARDVLERQIRDEKTHGESKKHPDEEYWEKRFGWWLEGE